jgi:hypothetical protein
VGDAVSEDSGSDALPTPPHGYAIGPTDTTPPRSPRALSHAGDGRDLLGAQARKRRDRTNPFGVPLSGPERLDTDTFGLVELLDAAAPDPTRTDPKIARIIQRSKHDTGAPVNVDMLAGFGDEIMRRLDMRMPSHDATAQLARDVATLQRQIAPVTRAANWVLGGIGAAALAVGIFLYTRGGDERATQMRLDALEKTVEEIRHDIRALERRGDNHKD